MRFLVQKSLQNIYNMIIPCYRIHGYGFRYNKHIVFTYMFNDIDI